MLKPITHGNWNFTTAAHLLNRAGFGGTPAEIGHLAGLGPERAVSQLVDYEKIPDPNSNPEWAKPDPTRADRFMEARKGDPETRRKLQQEEQRKQRQRSVE